MNNLDHLGHSPLFFLIMHEAHHTTDDEKGLADTKIILKCQDYSAAARNIPHFSLRQFVVVDKHHVVLA